MSELQENELITGEVRLSFVHVLEAVTPQGSTVPKFSVKVMVPKGDKATLDKLGKARDAARQRGVTEGKKPFKDMSPGELQSMTLSIEDGDLPKFADKNPEYKGYYVFNAKADADKAPGVLIIKEGFKTRVTKDSLDATEIYSGMWAKLHLQLYPYNNMSKGIGAGLINLIKTKDDDPFGGSVRKKAEDVFADFGDDVFGNAAAGTSPI